MLLYFIIFLNICSCTGDWGWSLGRCRSIRRLTEVMAIFHLYFLSNISHLCCCSGCSFFACHCGGSRQNRAGPWATLAQLNWQSLFWVMLACCGKKKICLHSHMQMLITLPVQSNPCANVNRQSVCVKLNIYHGPSKK